jgi:hypothetical protein
MHVITSGVGKVSCLVKKMSKEDKGLSTLYFSKYLGKSDDPHYDTL